MLAALASFGVMVSVMNLSGYVVVEHHHHAQGAVFPIIGAHVLGMYALVLVVGTLIDRIGRTPALAAGLLVMAALDASGCCGSRAWSATALLLFGLGVGWNVSFVAATAQLVDRASAAERGQLLGFNDLLSALFGAALALLGGYALDSIGVAALAIGATAIVVAPVLWLLPCVGAGQAARDDVALKSSTISIGRRALSAAADCDSLSGRPKGSRATSSRWRACRSSSWQARSAAERGWRGRAEDGKGAAMCRQHRPLRPESEAGWPRPMVRLAPQSVPR